MKVNKEYQLQKMCLSYLKLQYPNVVFMSTGIGIGLTIPQAIRNKAIQKPNFACPDIAIYQPNFYHHGLFIELKVKSPFKKNGELLKSDHLEGQQRTIDELNKLGYFATFAVGFDEFKRIVDSYMEHVELCNNLK